MAGDDVTDKNFCGGGGAAAITKEFLEETLNQKWGSSLLVKPGKLKVDRFTVSKGSAEGDGYMAVILSVDIWLENHEEFTKLLWQSLDWFKNVDQGAHHDHHDGPVSVIIKCFPETMPKQNIPTNGSTHMFRTELGVYEKVSMDLIKFQEDLGLSKIYKLPFPPFLSGSVLTFAEVMKILETRSLKCLDMYLIMTDIRKHGHFQLRDRFMGFDLDHFKLLMEAYAQIHALSWAYKTKLNIADLRSLYPFLQIPGRKPEVLVPMLRQLVEVAKGVVTHGMTGGQVKKEKIMRGLEGLFENDRLFQVYGLYYEYDPQYNPSNVVKETGGEEVQGNEEVAHPKIFTKDTILRVPGSSDDDEEFWRVMIHGDAWNNNLMFRYDEVTGKPVQVVILDLQLTRQGDPMTDLVCSIYTGTTAEIRANHLESMLRLYFDKFIQICDHFSVPPLPNFTWTELNRRFHRAKMYGLASGLMVIPVILGNPKVTFVDSVEGGTPPLGGGADDDDDSAKGKDTAEPMERTQRTAARPTIRRDLRESFGDPKEYTKVHPVMCQRLLGLLGDMEEEGVL